jgi:hypothetical protein
VVGEGWHREVSPYPDQSAQSPEILSASTKFRKRQLPISRWAIQRFNVMTLLTPAVWLQSRHKQAGNTGPIEHPLPTGEFLFGKGVELTRFFTAEDPGPHGNENGGLATRWPALGLRRRQHDVHLLSRCGVAGDAGTFTMSGFYCRSSGRRAFNDAWRPIEAHDRARLCVAPGAFIWHSLENSAVSASDNTCDHVYEEAIKQKADTKLTGDNLVGRQR